MAGLLTKNVKLSYTALGSTASYTEIANIKDFPELLGGRDVVDVTCLGDSGYRSIPGLQTTDSIQFTILFDNGTAGNFRTLKGLEGTKYGWRVEFPDAETASTGHGTQVDFEAFCTVAINGAGVNEAITATLTLYLQSDFTVTNPA